MVVNNPDHKVARDRRVAQLEGSDCPLLDLRLEP